MQIVPFTAAPVWMVLKVLLPCPTVCVLNSIIPGIFAGRSPSTFQPAKPICVPNPLCSMPCFMVLSKRRKKSTFLMWIQGLSMNSLGK